MKVLITISVVFWACFLQAQTVFNKVYPPDDSILIGDGGYSVEIIDSGYIVVGVGYLTEFENRLNTIYLKTDTKGDLIVRKGIGEKKAGYFITQPGTEHAILTNDKQHLLITGVRDDTAGNYNFFFVKTDLEGNVLIQKYYDKRKYDYGQQIKELPNGNYLIAGSSADSSFSTHYDVHLLWLDSAGNEIKDTIIIGGSGKDVGWFLKLTLDGGYIVSGYTADYNGKKGVYVLKFDSLDNLEWQSVVESNIAGGGAFPLMDGNYLVLSAQRNANDTDDGYLAKLSSNGQTILWDKVYGGTENDYFSDLKELSDGTVIISGQTKDETILITQGWLVKISANGNILWDKKYNTAVPSMSSRFREVDITDDGFIVTGSAHDSTINKYGIWLVKTDANGNTCLYTGAQAGYNHTVRRADTAITFTNTSNEVCELKWYFGDGDSLIQSGLNKTPFTHSYADTGTYEVTLIAYAGADSDTLTKTIRLACLYSGAQADYNHTVNAADKSITFTNKSNDVCELKWYFGNGDSLVQAGYQKASFTRYYPDTGTYEVTLIAYTTTDSDTLTKAIYIPPPSGVLSPSGEEAEVFSIYPNPVTDELTIEASGTVEMVLYDMVGKEVKRVIVNGKANINISGLRAGMYMYRTQGSVEENGKITIVK